MCSDVYNPRLGNLVSVAQLAPRRWGVDANAMLPIWAAHMGCRSSNRSGGICLQACGRLPPGGGGAEIRSPGAENELGCFNVGAAGVAAGTRRCGVVAALLNEPGVPQFRPETAPGRVFVALRRIVLGRENSATERGWGRNAAGCPIRRCRPASHGNFYNGRRRSGGRRGYSNAAVA